VSEAGVSETPRRAEVLAGLSVAIDLGLGQPAEHMLRSAVLASRLAERLGLTAEGCGTVYYTSLVWSVWSDEIRPGTRTSGTPVASAVSKSAVLAT
jgi:hypothetical protein